MSAPALRPDLARALDPEAIHNGFARVLGEGKEPCRLLQVAVADVRYRAGGPCWILYTLRVRDAAGRSHRIPVSARLLEAGEDPGRVPAGLAARYAASPVPGFPAPQVWFPEIPLVARPFPVDAALPGLFDAVSPEGMKHHLRLLWATRRIRIRRVTVETLGYTPEARASFSYHILSEERSTRLPEVRRLVGKMHAKKAASRIFADYWAIWSAAPHHLRIPPPVGYLGDVGLTLQEEVRGERLGGLVDQPGFLKHVRLAARMLAHLHGLEIPLSSSRKPQDEVRTVHRWAGVLLAIRPDLAPRIEHLRDRLSGELERRVRISTPIHADFHHTNILVSEHVPTFIDFDEAAMGDPMVDVGRFMASLRVPARRAYGNIAALNEAGGLFLDEYLARTGEDPRRARLLESASLVIAAGSSFRIQRRDWEDEVSLLVEESERVLASAGEGTAVSLAAPRSPKVPARVRTRLAGDPVYVQAALDSAIHTRFSVHPSSARRFSGSAEGSAVFEFRGERHGEPWSVIAEGHRRRAGGTRAFLTRLERVREAAQGPDALQLPRPIGVLPTLGMVFWERRDGVRFSSLLGTPEALPAVRIAGAALAAIHRTPVDLGVFRSREEDLASLERRLRILDPHPSLARTGRTVFAAVKESTSGETRLAPSLRVVHPRHLILVGGGAALDRVDDVVLAHPAADVADFLARCFLMRLEGKGPEGAEVESQAFRESYSRSAGTLDRLDAFEAGALLGLAVTRARRGARIEVLERLLEAAATKASVASRTDLP